MTRVALSHVPAGQDGAPPIPPRTYSQRKPSTNGYPGTGGLYSNFVMRKYRLEQFTFLKLLGKGSFGKVYYSHSSTFLILRGQSPPPPSPPNISVIHMYMTAPTVPAGA